VPPEIRRCRFGGRTKRDPKHLGFPEKVNYSNCPVQVQDQVTAKLSSEEGSRRMYWATRLHISSAPCPLRTLSSLAPDPSHSSPSHGTGTNSWFIFLFSAQLPGSNRSILSTEPSSAVQVDACPHGTRRRIGGFELQIWQVSSRLGLPACQQLTPEG